VVDSRVSDDGFVIKRRRFCPNCEKRFSTTETTSLFVVKRSGVLEEFSREKLLNGVRKAMQGQKVEEDRIGLMAQKVEEEIRSRGVSQIDSYDVGLALLPFLLELDEVAYLRYASVYQGFQRLADFEKEIARLRKTRAARKQKQQQ
jgi:transcriptional repressor NrdR